MITVLICYKQVGYSGSQIKYVKKNTCIYNLFKNLLLLTNLT